MKFLLVGSQTPEGVPNKEFILPSALLYLAAALRARDVEVNVLDLNTSGSVDGVNSKEFYERILLKRVSDFQPSVVGISCLFSGQFPDVQRYASVIKEAAPEVPIVIGGLHPTIYASEILAHCPYVDFVVLGEGEDTVVQFVDVLQGAGNFGDIDGFAYRSNGRVVVHEKKKFIADLDAVPFPAYDAVDLRDYHVDTSRWSNPKHLSFHASIPIVSSRSCPLRCNFCSMFLVMGSRWRSRSPANVVDEIQVLYEKYGQRYFAFMDDNLTLSRKHILEVCNLISMRGLDIQFDTPNGIATNTMDEEVLNAMVGAGLIRLSIAIESGSEFIRNKVMRKGLSNRKIYEVAALTKRYRDLYVRAFFVIGMPEETPETLRETEEMIRVIDVDEPHVVNIVPFPGTAVFDQALRDDLLIGGVDVGGLWSKPFFFSGNKRFFIRPYKMTEEELNEFRQRIDELTMELISTKAREKGSYVPLLHR
ncbi:MAG: radical SAM protein [Candidatus Jorgensenbacteria bacterium]